MKPSVCRLICAYGLNWSRSRIRRIGFAVRRTAFIQQTVCQSLWLSLVSLCRRPLFSIIYCFSWRNSKVQQNTTIHNSPRPPISFYLIYILCIFNFQCAIKNNQHQHSRVWKGAVLYFLQTLWWLLCDTAGVYLARCRLCGYSSGLVGLCIANIRSCECRHVKYVTVDIIHRFQRT